MTRKRLTLKTKLASAIRELFKVNYEHAKLMSEDQMLSLVNYDHGILYATDPIDEHWNLTPRMILPHREKSRRDTGIIAKAKRIDDKEAAHKERVELKTFMGEMQAHSFATDCKPSRWAKGRKMQSRKFQKRGKR